MSSMAYNNDALKQTKKQVDEVVDIMRDNVTAVMERDGKLTDLDDRADKLHQGAMIFEKQATTLKRKKWWQNMKMMIMIGVLVFVLILIIVISLRA